MNFLASKIAKSAPSSENLACRCAKLSQATYNEKGPLDTLDPKEYELLGFWKESILAGNIAQGFMVRDRSTGVGYLCFRGTQTKPDVVVDVFSIPGYRVPDTRYCWGHDGFNLAVASVEHKINATMDAYRLRQIVVTGHSLGAALAGTFALRNRHRVVEVVTFGCPLFFWVDPAEMGKAVWEWPFQETNMTHYVHMMDPVPRILGDSMAVEEIQRELGPKIGYELIKWARNYIQLGSWIQIAADGSQSEVVQKSLPYKDLWPMWKYHNIDSYAEKVCARVGVSKFKAFMSKIAPPFFRAY